MSLRGYVYFWLFASFVFAYESLCLNRFPTQSILFQVQSHTKFLSGLSLSPEAGKPISWYLGIAGFCVMLLTNPYILRKRSSLLRNWGNISNWLSFHIFCGLLGPTLIIFHTNFKVGGLVAISFWSMMVSFFSGIIGRYFYVQLLQHGAWLRQRVDKCEAKLEEYRQECERAVEEEVLTQVKQRALRLAGVIEGTEVGVLKAFSLSLVGDIKMIFQDPKVPPGFPEEGRFVLKQFALTKRKLTYSEAFQKLMGYWHSFHMPFAVFMYLVAVIHIVVAVLFRSY